MRFVWLLCVAIEGLLLLPGSAVAAPVQENAGLGIHPANPRYLIYQGKPFYLIGSGMESVNVPWSRTIPQWRDYLDLLQRSGMNRVRFFPWGVCWEDELLPTFSPWAVRDAKAFDFDLTRFNVHYWELVKQILAMARDRDIVVEYILFDYCCLDDRNGELPWTHCPLSAENHNGGAIPGRKGKPNIYGFSDYANLDLFRQPLDESWPWQKRNQWYQQLYVKHTIDELASFPNLYWEIMNEQGWGKVEPAGVHWARHWLAFLDKYDSHRHLRSINAADVYDELPGLDIVCEHPIPYFKKRELADPEVAVSVIARNLHFGKPVVCDETGYFPPQKSLEDEEWRTYTSQQLANERRAYWYAFVAGGHWTATCWQDFRERDTHRWIRHLADFVKQVPYWKMNPHDDLVDGGHCLAWPARHYVVYTGHGGTITLDLGNPGDASFQSSWLDPRTGRFSEATSTGRDGKRAYHTPSDDDWVLWVKRIP